MCANCHNEIIDISPSPNNTRTDVNFWRQDPLNDGIYPEGARDKEVYFSPKNMQSKLLKADWRYLFKLPRSANWCPWQFWVEIIAYRLGSLVGVNVPPAHVAFNNFYRQGDGNLFRSMVL